MEHSPVNPRHFFRNAAWATCGCSSIKPAPTNSKAACFLDGRTLRSGTILGLDAQKAQSHRGQSVLSWTSHSEKALYCIANQNDHVEL